MRHEHVTDMGPDRDAAGKKKWGAEVYMGMLNGSKVGASVFETRGFSRFNVVRVGSHVVAEPSNPLPSHAILVSSKLINRRSLLLNDLEALLACRSSHRNESRCL